MEGIYWVQTALLLPGCGSKVAECRRASAFLSPLPPSLCLRHSALGLLRDPLPLCLLGVERDSSQLRFWTGKRLKKKKKVLRRAMLWIITGHTFASLIISVNTSFPCLVVEIFKHGLILFWRGFKGWIYDLVYPILSFSDFTVYSLGAWSWYFGSCLISAERIVVHLCFKVVFGWLGNLLWTYALYKAKLLLSRKLPSHFLQRSAVTLMLASYLAAHTLLLRATFHEGIYKSVVLTFCLVYYCVCQCETLFVASNFFTDIVNLTETSTWSFRPFCLILFVLALFPVNSDFQENNHNLRQIEGSNTSFKTGLKSLSN